MDVIHMASGRYVAGSEHVEPDLKGLEQPTIWSDSRFICGVETTDFLLGLLNQSIQGRILAHKYL